MEKLTLTKNMRVRSDQYFSDFLFRVGNEDEPTNNEDMIAIPKEWSSNKMQCKKM